MKCKILVTLVLAVVAPALVSAGQASDVHYSGNTLAVKICKAAAEDDVIKLRMLLRSYRQTLTHGYMFRLDNAGVARDFSCNNLDLQQFSYRMGATKVAGYLGGDSTVARSQVAGTAE